jgi:ribosomal protein L7/L12
MSITKEEAIQYIKSLSSVELVKFIGELQDSLGVTLPESTPDPNRYVVMGAPPYRIDEDGYDGPPGHRVEILSLGDNKVYTLFEIRRIAGIELSEIKKISESLPYTLSNRFDRDTAVRLIEALKSCKAEATIQEIK